VASAAPRRLSVRLPGSVLLLPLVAAGFYYFAFFAGNESVASAEPGAVLSSERSAPQQAEPPLLDDGAAKRPGLQPLVIEEPQGPERRALDGVEAAAAPAAPAPSPVANTRALERVRRESAARELATMRERVNVTVYSTSWCPACRQLRSYLAQHGIRATEYDVERNRGASVRQRQLNPRGSVPTVEVDDQVLVGFSPESLEDALDRAARARLERL
jgi:glutaredoxin